MQASHLPDEPGWNRYLNNFLDALPEAILVLDSKGKVIEGNRAVESVFGRTAENLKGQPFGLLFGETGLPEKTVSDPSFQEQYKGYIGRTTEALVRRKNHGDLPVEYSLSRGEDEMYYLAVIRDLSHQKTIENGLREENRRLKQMQQAQKANHQKLNELFKQVEAAKQEWEMTMDCISDMVMLVDPNDMIIRCNKAAADFAGRQIHQLIGTNWEDLLFGNGMETNPLCGLGIELYHSPSNKWYILNQYPYGKSSDSRTGLVITLHNTTELKEITEELEIKNQQIEDNRHKLQLALNEISSLIKQVTATGNYQVRFLHPGLKRCWEHFQCSRKKCLCYKQEDPCCWLEGNDDCRRETKKTEPCGSTCGDCSIYQEVPRDPIFQIGEQFNNMMCILHAKNQELEDAYRELKNTQAQFLQQEKMASIGQLAAGVAHEINNPLGFISSNLGTLKKYLQRLTDFLKAQNQALDLYAPQKDEKVEVLRKKLKIDYILNDTAELIVESLDGADRVKKIIQDLKTFSRVDGAEKTTADIIECLESTINIVWNELKYKATLKKEYEDLPPVECYAQQLNQVFMNLLVNAAHAIEKQGEITVRASQKDQHILVAIADTGCGIPPENLKKLFEPFFTTKAVGKGTGLGLSIAYDIVKKHKGEILVESEQGKGSTFTVRIPIRE